MSSARLIRELELLGDMHARTGEAMIKSNMMSVNQQTLSLWQMQISLSLLPIAKVSPAGFQLRHSAANRSLVNTCEQ